MKDNEVYIKARSNGRIYKAECGNLTLEPMDEVLFESDQCQEIGRILPQKLATQDNEGERDDTKITIIRRLSERDQQIDADQKKEARLNLDKCKVIIEKYQLPMELLDADLSFDGKKLTFFFSAPGRVDFRSLVSELASTFQKLIRLQQVGARDRARCVGGLGRCGREFCCQKFLKGDLECVTLDMAYTQNLAQMGSNRITGACGKLMCCLKYELDVYEKGTRKMPAIGENVKTKKGPGMVIARDIIKNSFTVELDKDKTKLEVAC